VSNWRDNCQVAAAQNTDATNATGIQLTFTNHMHSCKIRKGPVKIISRLAPADRRPYVRAVSPGDWERSCFTRGLPGPRYTMRDRVQLVSARKRSLAGPQGNSPLVTAQFALLLSPGGKMLRAAHVAVLCAFVFGCGVSTDESPPPQPESRSLTVSINGSGMVTSAPSGINCSANCSAAFPAGASVALTATPAVGFVFAGWDGACSGAAGCTVTLGSDTSVTARFSSILPPPPRMHNLTVAVEGQGTVTSTPGGINCAGACTARFDEGAHIVLTVRPYASWSFTGWSGACSGSGDCHVTLSTDTSVTARFDAIPAPPPPPASQHALTVTVEGKGRVSSSPAGIDCTQTCTVNFDAGAQVVLTATPDSGWQLSGWSGACNGSNCALTMSGDASAKATFTQVPPPPPPATISVTIAPSSASVVTGGTYRFTATVTGTTDASVSWAVREAQVGGSVDAAGLYLAPTTAGTYHVIVTSHADPSQSAVATVVVTSPPPPTVSVTVSPSDVAMPSNVRPAWRFTAAVTGASDSSVRWSIEEGGAGGTIDSTGMYTSPLTAGVFHVVATSNADPSAFGTAIVRTNTPVIDHGGLVVPSLAIYAIWWGSRTVFGDAPMEMASLFSGLNGTAYLRTLDQYMRGPKATVSFAGNLFDSSAPPSTPPSIGDIQAEICGILDANGISPRPDGFYAVFADNGPPFSASAWHSWTVCHDAFIQVAYHLNVTSGVANPPRDACGRSLISGTLAMNAVHELFETMTDPSGEGWADPLNTIGGAEIADKCSFFPLFTCNVVLSNGSSWRLPRMWSNSAGQCVFDTP
jgi:hypothetical protein